MNKGEIMTSTSTVNLMLFKLVQESKSLGNNAAEDFSGFLAIQEGSTDRHIVEEKITPPNPAFMNIDHALVNSVVKIEAGDEYFEIENVPFDDTQRNSTNLRRMEILYMTDNILFDHSYCKTPLADSSEFKDAIKTENSEAINESNVLYDVTYEDWKIKNEELDIKVEDLQKETSIPPYCGQEKPNHNQRIQCEPLRHTNLTELKTFSYIRTIDVNDLRRHLLRHNNPKEVNTFKCDQCDYQTIHKNYLRKHFLSHKNPKEVNTFKCDQCDYQTIHKNYLRKHFLSHKNPKEVNTFKCDQCDYQTSHNNLLKGHLFGHQNPISCFSIPPYCGQEKPNHNQRIQCESLSHTNLTELKMCSYIRTIDVNDLRRHLSTHKNPKEGNTFKCHQCDYQTIHKNDLRRHLLRHKNPKEVNTFKCDQCDYETSYKYLLDWHLLDHNSKDINILKCDQCDYKTIHNNLLKEHLFGHKNPKEVNRFKCDQCDYQTNHIYFLNSHIFFNHYNPKDINMFKCD